MELTIQQYNNAIQFALNMIRRHDCTQHIDKMDVVHDAICDCDFCDTNWKGIIIKYVYKYKYTQFTYQLDAVPKSKDWIEHRYCKCCDSIMPEDHFISGFNSITNEWQYRTVCKYCYKGTDSYKEKNKQTNANYYQKNREKLKAYHKELRKKSVDKTAKERYQRWKQKQKDLKMLQQMLSLN
jgi:hypothetical protein